MANSNNPAGRLYLILREAKRQEGDLSVLKVWVKVFSFDPTEVRLVFERLTQMFDLLGDAEKEIKRLEVKTDLYLKHFATLREILLPTNLDEPWHIRKGKLGENVLESLEFCSERLEKVRPEKEADSEEIKKLQKEIGNLFSKIEAAEIEDELKTVLLDVLQSMQAALAEYRIRGISGMREECYYILARLERHVVLLHNEQANPEVKSVMKLLQWWETVSSVCLNTPQIAGGVKHLIDSIM